MQPTTVIQPTVMQPTTVCMTKKVPEIARTTVAQIVPTTIIKTEIQEKTVSE